MNIRIIQLGKDKDSWLKEAIAEYQKRLRPFCKLEILELADVSIRDAGTRQVIDREAKAVLAKIDPSDYLILLDEKGSKKARLNFPVFD
jgi:23S rRNA (pseudouridine1915-N3)-methyltransferase